MNDPVRVRRDHHEKTVERATAERKGWHILEDESAYEHGRLRGTTRIGGRKIKPKENLPPAIPTTDDLSDTDDTDFTPTDDGPAVAEPQEADE